MIEDYKVNVKRQKNIDKALDIGLEVPFTKSNLKEDVLENR